MDLILEQQNWFLKNGSVFGRKDQMLWINVFFLDETCSEYNIFTFELDKRHKSIRLE